MKLDIKTLIVLGSLAVTFGGFYYGTEYRLNSLEQEISEVKKDNSKLSSQVQRLLKRVKRLEK